MLLVYKLYEYPRQTGRHLCANRIRGRSPNGYKRGLVGRIILVSLPCIYLFVGISCLVCCFRNVVDCNAYRFLSTCYTESARVCAHCLRRQRQGELVTMQGARASVGRVSVALSTSPNKPWIYLSSQVTWFRVPINCNEVATPT